jgi:hypothetical protein
VQHLRDLQTAAYFRRYGKTREVEAVDQGSISTFSLDLMEEGSHKAHRSAKAGRKAEKKVSRKKGDAGVSKNAKLNNPKVERFG